MLKQADDHNAHSSSRGAFLPSFRHNRIRDVWRRLFCQDLVDEVLGEPRCIGKAQENGGFMGFDGIYPLVNVYIIMENHHLNGKTHDFNCDVP